MCEGAYCLRHPEDVGSINQTDQHLKNDIRFVLCIYKCLHIIHDLCEYKHFVRLKLKVAAF
jgi:hypothetical protein